MEEVMKKALKKLSCVLAAALLIFSVVNLQGSENDSTILHAEDTVEQRQEEVSSQQDAAIEICQGASLTIESLYRDDFKEENPFGQKEDWKSSDESIASVTYSPNLENDGKSLAKVKGKAEGTVVITHTWQSKTYLSADPEVQYIYDPEGDRYLCTQTFSFHVNEGHFGEEIIRVVTEPTCTGYGKNEVICSNCGKKLRTYNTKPLGHDPDYEGAYEVLIEPDCLTDGQASFSCRREGCQKKVTGTLPAYHKRAEECPNCHQLPFSHDGHTLTFHLDIADLTSAEAGTDVTERYGMSLDQVHQIVLDENVKYIGDYAFANMYGLRSVGKKEQSDHTAVLDVEYVGNDVFKNGNEIQRYVFGPQVVKVYAALSSAKDLRQDDGRIDSIEIQNTEVTGEPGYADSGFLPGSLQLGSTKYVRKLIINDPDGRIGKKDAMASSWDGMDAVELNVAEIHGTISSDTLTEITVIGDGSTEIPADWCNEPGEIDAGSSTPQLRKVHLYGISKIGENAFSGSALEELIVENMEHVQLAYSDVFSRVYDGYIRRVEAILDGAFSLHAIADDEEMHIPEGYESAHLGENNAVTVPSTQIAKAARWTNAEKTKAEVRIDFSYNVEKGRDFLFVLDYSASMAAIGNENDQNSKYDDMRSKMLDVSEELLKTEGYHNRVSILTFSNDATAFLPMTKDLDEIRSFLIEAEHESDRHPNGYTNYARALNQVHALIEEDYAESEEKPAVIFISDGVPSHLFDGSNSASKEELNAEAARYADQIRASGADLIGVLQSTQDDVDAVQSMEAVCGDRFYVSSDTQGFSDAVNASVMNALGAYELVDTIHSNFAYTGDYQVYADGKKISDTTVVTFDEEHEQVRWNLWEASPYTDYTLIFSLDLKKTDDTYLEGMLDTNEGMAWVSDANGEIVNQVKTPVLGRGTVLIQPADMTVYMGGEDGYAGVSIEDGSLIGSDSLPEVGFYLTLPPAVDAYMKEVWASSDDITEIKKEDGSISYVMDLSDYVYFTDDTGTKRWNLCLYSDSYSLAYGKYIYRLTAAEGQDPVRMLFTDAEGNTQISDSFYPSNALYQRYSMQIFSDSIDEQKVIAHVRIAEDSEAKFFIEQRPGELTVRYVMKDHADAVFAAVHHIDEALDANGNLLHPTVEIAEGTRFFINNSSIYLNDQSVSLLFDDIIDNEESVLLDQLSARTLDTLGLELKDPQYEAKYLDLVDATNGNVWLTSDRPVQVYWPYPEGTGKEDIFYLVHFKDLDREIAHEDLLDEIAQSETEVIPVETLDHSIRFSADRFSPYVLVWESAQDPDVDPNREEPPADREEDGSDTAAGNNQLPLAAAVMISLSAIAILWYRKHNVS